MTENEVLIDDLGKLYDWFRVYDMECNQYRRIQELLAAGEQVEPYDKDIIALHKEAEAKKIILKELRGY
jgi:hypothetical protein